jgi:hypothetical protein
MSLSNPFVNLPSLWRLSGSENAARCFGGLFKEAWELWPGGLLVLTTSRSPMFFEAIEAES